MRTRRPQWPLTHEYLFAFDVTPHRNVQMSASFPGEKFTAIHLRMQPTTRIALGYQCTVTLATTKFSGINRITYSLISDQRKACNKTGLTGVQFLNVSTHPARNRDRIESYPTAPVDSADWQSRRAADQPLGQDHSAMAEYDWNGN